MLVTCVSNARHCTMAPLMLVIWGVTGPSDLIMQTYWCVSSGLPPSEAPVMIAEKRKLFFSFLFLLVCHA